LQVGIFFQCCIQILYLCPVMHIMMELHFLSINSRLQSRIVIGESR